MIKQQVTVQLLSSGFVTLVDGLLDLSLIAKVARVSHGKETGNDEQTFKFLLTKGHTGPLESNMMVFHVKAPIFVARQWMRHRVGLGFTERSLRYCEANPEFYLEKPEDTTVYMASWQAYKQALDAGEKREIARRFLPLGLYTEFFFYPNLAAFYHFCDLRLAKDAQEEIREYAQAMLWTIGEIDPVFTRVYREVRYEQTLSNKEKREGGYPPYTYDKE